MTLLDMGLYALACFLAVAFMRLVARFNARRWPDLPEPQRTLDLTGRRK